MSIGALDSHMHSSEGHPIRVVSRRTGLSPHVIRIWEKRYDAVVPSRTEKNRRLYSDADIHRLNLLRELTAGGRRIGDIAGLSTEQLEAMLGEDQAAIARVTDVQRSTKPSAAVDLPARDHLERCLQAISLYDDKALARALSDAHVDLGQLALIDTVIMPLMRQVGDMWSRGEIRVAEEHLASAVIRTFVGNLIAAQDIPDGAPSIVITTPIGHVHEYGALVAAAIAASDGWRVSYLGPNLPAEEIASVARRKGVEAVAMSIIYPSDNSQLVDELKRLAKLLPAGCALLIGGQAAESYIDTMKDIKALYLEDLGALRQTLRHLRSQHTA